MPNLKHQIPNPPVRPRSQPKTVLFSLGFLLLALGAFTLTFEGGWIWLGALLWGFAGVAIAAALIRDVTNSAPTANFELDNTAGLRSQLKRLDQACEQLQDHNWELREAEQKYKTLLNRQGDIILHLGPDGDLEFANDAFARFFEQSKEGSPFRPDETAIKLQQDDAELAGADPLWEKLIETQEGPRWFRWTETMMRSTQKGERRLVIARDVTAYKRMEAASEAKSRFLATISHEMRTPLNGIIGMATLLETTPLTPEQTSYSQALRQSGTALLALVNDVLDLSRIEANKMTLSHEWTSPARLMEDVVELLAPDAQEKGLSVASWVGQSVPDKLLIDPVRVRQILVNLVGNAIKFTPEGAINLSLDCETKPVEGEMATILLSVRDTGPGIDEDMHARLFEEFEQADTARTRRHEGSGLGLAISQRLARMMQGDILLSSKPGKGSTFTLRLEASWLNEGDEQQTEGMSEDQTENLASGDQTGQSSRSGSSQRIGAELAGDRLVGIDLTQADRRALHSYCKDWGIEFHAFSLAEWQQQGADIIPDHLLINGADPDKAEGIISSFHPLQGGKLTRPVPRSRVILLEPSERRVIPQMREGGINAYLVKPVRQASLHLALLGHPEATDSKNRFEAESSASTANVIRLSDGGSTLRGGPEKDTGEEAEIAYPHVLLVEDNEINALLARAILTKAGMSVDLAKSGAEALALYDDGATFDLALIDLHMPDMDGMALFDAMKQRDLDLDRAIPKIAFTADALQETKDACHRHGFDGYIVKPAAPEQLVSHIRTILKMTK